MQEFSPSGERILIHQKTREIWDSMKDHSSWEGWAKMKIHQKQNSIKLRKMRKRKSKIHFIKKKKKCVQSSQEKWKCIRKDNQGEMQNHPRKMKSVKLKEKNAVEWKPIKFPKKKKKKRRAR